MASLVDQRFTCKTKCVTDIESIKTLVHTEGAAMYPGLPPSSTSDISIQPLAKKKKSKQWAVFSSQQVTLQTHQFLFHLNRKFVLMLPTTLLNQYWMPKTLLNSGGHTKLFTHCFLTKKYLAVLVTTCVVHLQRDYSSDNIVVY